VLKLSFPAPGRGEIVEFGLIQQGRKIPLLQILGGQAPMVQVYLKSEGNYEQRSEEMYRALAAAFPGMLDPTFVFGSLKVIFFVPLTVLMAAGWQERFQYREKGIQAICAAVPGLGPNSLLEWDAMAKPPEQFLLALPELERVAKIEFGKLQSLPPTDPLRISGEESEDAKASVPTDVSARVQLLVNNIQDDLKHIVGLSVEQREAVDQHPVDMDCVTVASRLLNLIPVGAFVPLPSSAEINSLGGVSFFWVDARVWVHITNGWISCARVGGPVKEACKKFSEFAGVHQVLASMALLHNFWSDKEFGISQ